MLDPVVERIWPARAERRLEGIEDQFLGRGADGVDGHLPAGVVRPPDRGGELVGLPVDVLPPPIVEVDLQPLDTEAVVDGARFAIVYQSPKNSAPKFSAR